MWDMMYPLEYQDEMARIHIDDVTYGNKSDIEKDDFDTLNDIIEISKMHIRKILEDIKDIKDKEITDVFITPEVVVRKRYDESYAITRISHPNKISSELIYECKIKYDRHFHYIDKNNPELMLQVMACLPVKDYFNISKKDIENFKVRKELLNAGNSNLQSK